eukprot:Selendium_serpulae@DN6509_c4_g2_i14.p1
MKYIRRIAFLLICSFLFVTHVFLRLAISDITNEPLPAKSRFLYNTHNTVSEETEPTNRTGSYAVVDPERAPNSLMCELLTQDEPAPDFADKLLDILLVPPQGDLELPPPIVTFPNSCK